MPYGAIAKANVGVLRARSFCCFVPLSVSVPGYLWVRRGGSHELPGSPGPYKGAVLRHRLKHWRLAVERFFWLTVVHLSHVGYVFIYAVFIIDLLQIF
jgi:hypothetical protein